MANECKGLCLQQFDGIKCYPTSSSRYMSVEGKQRRMYCAVCVCQYYLGTKAFVLHRCECCGKYLRRISKHNRSSHRDKLETLGLIVRY